MACLLLTASHKRTTAPHLPEVRQPDVWSVSTDYEFHITNALKDLNSAQLISFDERPYTIRLRGGKEVSATHIGIVDLRSAVGGEERRFFLVKVLCASEFPGKVVSLGQIAKAGVDIHFKGDRMEFLMEGFVTAEGRRHGDRYFLESLEPQY